MTMDARMSRRDVLISTGLAAAGLAAGARVAGLLGGSNEAHAAVNAADWSDLASSSRGSLLLPSSPQYPVARLPWNTIYDDVRPQAILQAADARDVQQAVNFCRDHGVQPTARSGGHSFMGFSVSTGLIIDVSAMNQVSLSPDSHAVRIGAGAQLIDIYRQLFDQAKVAIAGGTCPNVGISGLTQGGGVGPFIRQYGLTLDRLLAAEIVTADGQVRRISAKEVPDLFWAIRGGGGGNFGVVTSFDFATVPADMLLNNDFLTFAWRDAERVLEAFQTWPVVLPITAHPTLIYVTSTQGPKAQPTASVELWHRGPRAVAQACLREFIREVGATPVSQTRARQPFFQAEFDEYCAGLTQAECAPVTDPSGQLPRVGLATYSEISRQAWPRVANAVMIEELERWQRDPVLQPPGVDSGLQAGKVIIEPIGGAVHDIAPTATAFPHREGSLVYQFQSRVRPGAPADVVAAGQEWVTGLTSRLTPWRTGAEYSNYGNRALKGWGHAYYGVNLPRLRRIKAARDPGNLFRFEQSIRPSVDRG